MTRLWVPILTLCLAGCGSEATPTRDGAAPDAAIDTGVREDGGRPSSVRCATPPPSTETSCSVPGGPPALLFVADRHGLATPASGGLVPGFDLDDRVSTEGDADSCFTVDSTSPPPYSEEGVDSQVGVVIADLNLDDDFDEGVRAAIDRGELLPVLWLGGLDDMLDDDCVEIGLVYGRMPPSQTAPMLDGDGRFAAGQVLDLQAAWLDADGLRPRFTLVGSVVDGALEASGSDAEVLLPFPPDYEVATFHPYAPRFRARLSPEGLVDGALGGSVDQTEFLDAVASGLTPVLRDAVMAVVHEQVDLAPVDGACTCASIAFHFDARPVVWGAVVE